MAILDIEFYGSDVLRKVAAPVEEITPEVLKLLDDMVETMRYGRGAGLAANQVGVPMRLVVVDLAATSDDPESLVFCINPELVEQDGTDIQEEGCLSIPEVFEKVKRPRYVKIRALDREGNPFELEGEGFLAKAFCHELDHLDGILFVDRLSPIRRDIVKRRIKKMIRDGEWENYYERLHAKLASS